MTIFFRLLAAASLLLPLSAATAQSLYLTGRIGTAPVLVTVDRSGADLSGWYFYSRYGRQIRLEGKLDAKGNFRFDEFQDKDNSKTGVFEGTVKGADWTGTWHKPDGGGALPLALTENRDTLASLTAKLNCSTSFTDRQFGFTYTHDIKLTIAKGTVKAFDMSRTAKGGGDEQSCSIALSDLEQKPAKTGILLHADSDTPDGSCDIRLVRAGDYLYVEVGADCRGTSDTMFCSPRAFWTDLIVDRAAKVCRQVQ